MPISDDLMDRLKAALYLDSDGNVAMRVQYAVTPSTGSGTRALPEDLMDRLKGSFVLTDAAIADGAPAMRGQAV